MVTSMRWTIADVEALPERLDDHRYEIMDGALYVSSQPDWRHQLVGDAVWDVLNRWSQRLSTGMAITAPGVIFSPEDAVAPDLVWVRRERFRAVLGADGKLHGAPDLMVEVLSPGTKNTRRDRETKLHFYARWGVLEYWIIDWPARRVETFRRSEAQLAPVATLEEDDTLQSPHLPGFQAVVGEFFSQIPAELRHRDRRAVKDDDD